MLLGGEIFVATVTGWPLHVTSAITIDIPCQRLPCLLLRCHLTPSPLMAKMAEKVGRVAPKNMMVSDGNLSPHLATNDGFGSGIHLPPPPATRLLSPIDCHCPQMLLLLLPH